MSERSLVTPDTEFIKYLSEHGGDTLKKCFQCATCSVVCSLSPKEHAFPRKEMIHASWGHKEYLLSDPDIWLCHGCTDCSASCPRGAKPAEVMAAIRSYVVRSFAVPGFMGSALKDPKYLVPLLLAPTAALFAIPYANLDGDFSELKKGRIEFDKLFPELSLEIFFTAGNMLVFSLAGIGLYKYWRNLKSAGELTGSQDERPLRALSAAGIDDQAQLAASGNDELKGGTARVNRNVSAGSILDNLAQILGISAARVNLWAKRKARDEGGKLKSALKAGIDAFNEERIKNS